MEIAWAVMAASLIIFCFADRHGMRSLLYLAVVGFALSAVALGVLDSGAQPDERARPATSQTEE